MRRLLGSCSESALFERITQAVEALANSGDLDLLMGDVDLCVSNRCVTLPREVDNVLAININGTPAIPRDQVFRYHLNGPGNYGHVGWSWQDKNWACTYRDLTVPSKIVAWVTNEVDAGKEVWVYGLDQNQMQVRSLVNGVWVEGWQVPTIFNYVMPSSDAPMFSRITRVRKEVTQGPIRLGTWDSSATTGIMLGVYEADETDPQYRRIMLSVDAEYITVRYRKRLFQIKSQHDWIPLPSRNAVLFMLRALKEYDSDVAKGEEYEANARRFLTEAEAAQTTPGVSPIQVNGEITLADHSDPLD